MTTYSKPKPSFFKRYGKYIVVPVVMGAGIVMLTKMAFAGDIEKRKIEIDLFGNPAPYSQQYDGQERYDDREDDDRGRRHHQYNDRDRDRGYYYNDNRDRRYDQRGRDRDRYRELPAESTLDIFDMEGRQVDFQDLYDLLPPSYIFDRGRLRNPWNGSELDCTEKVTFNGPCLDCDVVDKGRKVGGIVLFEGGGEFDGTVLIQKYSGPVRPSEAILPDGSKLNLIQ